MFNRIVIGVDEHEGASDAIALGKRLIAPGGRIILAFVYSEDPYVYRGVSALYEADERERTLERLRQVKADARIEAEVTYILSTSAGRGLHELAEREVADLLLVGSCRRSLLGRVLIGDETHAALNGASCAVAVAPAGYANQDTVIREIGVGYDESPEAKHALEVARELAAALDARLSAFEAISLPSYLFDGESAPAEESIDDFVNDARERIAALGGVEPHAAYGHPAEELAIYSASVDLLVVGSRGYGPLGRLIHGSTSHQLARSARCPLLVLPRLTSAIEAPDAREERQESKVGAASAVE